MSLEMDLPGFRFHPTEEELLDFYLKNTISGKNTHYDIIGLTNIYHYHPRELPGLAKIGEREWYFFVPRDRKQGSGGAGAGRPNRTTGNGFWKATGSDRRILSSSEPKRTIGLKKTLVFYLGRAPRGAKTDWVMNEYRLPDSASSSFSTDIVLCKVYRKATSLKVLEQRAATVEEISVAAPACSSPSSAVEAVDAVSFPDPWFPPNLAKEEPDQEMIPVEAAEGSAIGVERGGAWGEAASTILLPVGCDNVPELQMPGRPAMDWTQEPFWNQLGSPWFMNLTPTASILNI